MENVRDLPQFEVSFFDGRVRITLTRGSYHKDIDYTSPLHFHSDYELHYIKSGSFVFTVNGRDSLCREQSLFIIPPDTYHIIHALEPGTKLCFQCRIVKESPSFSLKQGEPLPLKYEMHEAELFIRILSEFKENPDDSNIQKLQSIITIILLNINRRLGEQLLSQQENCFVKTSTIDNILNYISDNYYKKIVLSDIAGNLFLSERQLTRIIKTETGETFNSLLARLRINHAKKLISESGRSMEEISAAVGFSTYSGFWKAFCGCENLTPSEYRKKVKNAAKGG